MNENTAINTIFEEEWEKYFRNLYQPQTKENNSEPNDNNTSDNEMNLKT